MGMLLFVYLATVAAVGSIAIAYLRGYGMRPKSYPPGRGSNTAGEDTSCLGSLHFANSTSRPADVAGHRESSPDAHDRSARETSRMVEEV